MSVKEIRIIYNDDSAAEGHDWTEGDRIDHEAVAKTAEEVGSALSKKGFSVATTPLGGASGIERFVREISDGKLIFNLCEAAFGRSVFEMNVAALLELYGLMFTGSPPLTLGLALDKGLSKDLLKGRGIPTPEYSVLGALPSRLKLGLNFPLIVKPLQEDASLGIDSKAVVRTMKELKERVAYIIGAFSQPAIVEEYIEGREFNVAVMGNGKGTKALPPSELTFVDFPEGVPKICSYEAKWDCQSPLYKKTVPVCPAAVPDSLSGEMASIAVKAYEIMGCRDYARVDMRLGEDGNLRVLEVNPNPDISSNAGLARSAGVAGFEYPEFIAEVVRIAEARYNAPQSLRRAGAGKR